MKIQPGDYIKFDGKEYLVTSIECDTIWTERNGKKVRFCTDFDIGFPFEVVTIKKILEIL